MQSCIGCFKDRLQSHVTISDSGQNIYLQDLLDITCCLQLHLSQNAIPDPESICRYTRKCVGWTHDDKFHSLDHEDTVYVHGWISTMDYDAILSINK